MNKEHRRIAAIVSTDSDPLFDPSDRDVLSLVNALWCQDGELFLIPRSQKRSKIIEFAVVRV
jgi:hypothetical protein